MRGTPLGKAGRVSPAPEEDPTPLLSLPLQAALVPSHVPTHPLPPLHRRERERGRDDEDDEELSERVRRLKAKAGNNKKKEDLVTRGFALWASSQRVGISADIITAT
jgi:hypothetical protein